MWEGPRRAISPGNPALFCPSCRSSITQFLTVVVFVGSWIDTYNIDREPENVDLISELEHEPDPLHALGILRAFCCACVMEIAFRSKPCMMPSRGFYRLDRIHVLVPSFSVHRDDPAVGVGRGVDRVTRDIVVKLVNRVWLGTSCPKEGVSVEVPVLSGLRVAGDKAHGDKAEDEARHRILLGEWDVKQGRSTFY